MNNLIFPVVIKINESHGLEPSSKEGRDFFYYYAINSPDEFPKEISFTILGSIDISKLDK
jgi:hypothetical protein